VEGVEGLKVAIVGLGFVGLTSALGFADKGFEVRGYDINAERAAKIKGGEVPFLEPGLDLALKRTIGGKFTISSSASNAAESADGIFFCVGTPCGVDGKSDSSFLFSAIDSVMDAVDSECILVVKSTVPPGTMAKEVLPYVRSKGFNGSVTVNPEFLREGYCWQDFVSPDRIVCGCEENDASAMKFFSKLYAPFDAPIHFISPNTAEFIKYLSNSLLASLISFSNEMALIAEAAGGINIAKAFRILHEDKRLSGAGIRHYIYPGCGYGGYCLPKDTVALSAKAKETGVVPHILDNVISLNDDMPRLSARKIERAAGTHEARIGILGLSFKPNSDDVRDTPAAKIVACLLRDGYNKLYAYDPVATEAFRAMYGFDITYCESKEEVCNACDAVAVVTSWPEFQGIHKLFPKIKICDCRYWLEN